jgi:DNA-binding GntR family transcriptional regulator
VEPNVTDLGPLEPVSKTTTPSIIADRIRAGIMNGTFAPGSQLGEAQLAASLRVSRGPVREAMQRLIQEGLLRSEPHRGVFVASIDAVDMRDVYFVRGAIERAAVRRLFGRGDHQLLDELDELIDRMQAAATRDRWGSVADLDLEFHERIVAAAGSRRLTRMFATLMVETRMCMSALEAVYPRRQDIVTEHRELLEALRGGSEARSVEVVDRHLEDAVARLEGLI